MRPFCFLLLIFSTFCIENVIGGEEDKIFQEGLSIDTEEVVNTGTVEKIMNVAIAVGKFLWNYKLEIIVTIFVLLIDIICL